LIHFVHILAIFYTYLSTALSTVVDIFYIIYFIYVDNLVDITI